MDASRIEKGSILYGSWGYEQTNVDFYKVLKVFPTSVMIQAMLSKEESDGPLSMTGRAIPAELNATEKPVRRKVHNIGNEQWVKLTSYIYLRLWDGKPKSYSSYA